MSDMFGSLSVDSSRVHGPLTPSIAGAKVPANVAQLKPTASQLGPPPRSDPTRPHIALANSNAAINLRKVVLNYGFNIFNRRGHFETAKKLLLAQVDAMSPPPKNKAIIQEKINQLRRLDPKLLSFLAVMANPGEGKHGVDIAVIGQLVDSLVTGNGTKAEPYKLLDVRCASTLQDKLKGLPLATRKYLAFIRSSSSLVRAMQGQMRPSLLESVWLQRKSVLESHSQLQSKIEALLAQPDISPQSMSEYNPSTMMLARDVFADVTDQEQLRTWFSSVGDLAVDKSQGLAAKKNLFDLKLLISNAISARLVQLGDESGEHAGVALGNLVSDTFITTSLNSRGGWMTFLGGESSEVRPVGGGEKKLIVKNAKDLARLQNELVTGLLEGKVTKDDFANIFKRTEVLKAIDEEMADTAAGFGITPTPQELKASMDRFFSCLNSETVAFLARMEPPASKPEQTANPLFGEMCAAAKTWQSAHSTESLATPQPPSTVV